MSSEVLIIGDVTSHVTHSVLAMLSVLKIPYTYKAVSRSPDFYHHKNKSRKFASPPAIIYNDHQYNDPVHFLKTITQSLPDPSPWFPSEKIIQSKVSFAMSSIHNSSRKALQVLFKDVSQDFAFLRTKNLEILSETFFMTFAEEFLINLDFNLKKTGFIAKTSEPTYADVFVFFEVMFLTVLKPKTAFYPAVHKWAQYMREISGVKEVMERLKGVKGSPYQIVNDRIDKLGEESLNKFKILRENTDSYYIMAIDDFMILSGYEQEYFFYLIFTVVITGLKVPHFEGFKAELLNRKGQHKSLFLLFEKDYHTLAAFVFDSIDTVYYKPNDTSEQNKYLVTFSYGAMQPCFDQSLTFDKLLAYSRSYLFEKFQTSNIISFNTTLSPTMYESICKLSPLVFPKPTYNNPVLESLLKKLIAHYNCEGETKENSFVVQKTIRIIGDEVPLFKKNYPTASAEFKYFVDKTGLKNNHLLATVSIEKLVEGNTLNLEAKTHFNYAGKMFEVKHYESLASLSYKI